MQDFTFPMLLVLLVFGAMLVALEVFLTPGVGIKAFMGLALIIFSVAMAYERFGAVRGSLMLGMAAVSTGGLLWIGKQTIARRLVLGASIATPPPASADVDGLAGHEGVAVSALRPSGIAEIGRHRVDVSCRGEFVEKGTAIRVVAVEGHRVFVEKI